MALQEQLRENCPYQQGQAYQLIITSMDLMAGRMAPLPWRIISSSWMHITVPVCLESMPWCSFGPVCSRGKILDSVQLPEIVAGRVTTTVHDGKNYLYAVGVTQVYRYEWNGKNLTLDNSWGPVSYLKPGQTGGTAASVMGDWSLFKQTGPHLLTYR